MSVLDDISQAASEEHLSVFGLVGLAEHDGLDPTLSTLILLGPEEPGFWAHVTGSQEWRDGTPDPVDRWSRRVIGRIAEISGGSPLFPFDGPPYLPFFDWALRSGRAFASPATLLVHDRAGLMVSYRGAIAIDAPITMPGASPSPCSTCATKPCMSACPAAAITQKGYDIPACQSFLDQQQGMECISRGCAVRRACPVSLAYGRVEEQSAYHMRIFHR